MCPPGSLCTDTDCVNYASQQECGSSCPAGPSCGNRRIALRDWTPLTVFDAGKKGSGLRAEEAVARRTFIIEYVGEAVSASVLLARFREYKDQKMLYILQLSPQVFVDARRTGGIARFINHSCDPNCTMEKWHVNGVPR
ncbi:hypothetical protein TeGR_g9766 [Tetraparma gracilis]|uniref:Uncharacterized protein n=1 Tax=Tetraparma gracilis TaxID=2962635 RepID=A0ABQ6MZJ1_9STRA|nr:hypothetical protein TeGR_g9766 [Tetraparma gracilis]